MKYTVYYKRTNQIFWRKIKDVVGDLKLDSSTVDGSGNSMPFSYPLWEFVRENQEIIRVPMENVIVRFSKERFMCIRQKMETEAGQQMKLRMPS